MPPPRLAWLLALTLVAGCVDRDPLFDQPRAVLPPLEADGAVLVLDETLRQFTVIREQAGAAQLSPVPFAGRPDVVRVTADGTQVVLLERARRQLHVLAPASKQVQSVALGAEFAGLVLADDGGAAVAWHEGAGQGAGSLVNTAEVSLVELDATPLQVRTATVAGLGKAPLRVRAAARVQANDGAHRLVWVEAASLLGICDFGPNGQVRTAVVPLATADSTAQIVPLRTVARAGAGVVDLYLIAQGSNDVVHLTITLGAELSLSLDQIAAGAGPADLAVLETKAGLRLLVVTRLSNELALLDPGTGTGSYVPLDGKASALVPFAGADGRTRALAWQADGSLPYFFVVDVDDLAKKKGKAVQRVPLELALQRVVPAGERFVLVHPSASAGLSVYDAASGKRTAFAGAGTVLDTEVVGDRAFVLGKVGFFNRLSRIDLADLHGASIELQLDGQALVRLGAAGVGVWGQGVGGFWLLLVPAGELDASKTTLLEGFTLQGVLQEAK